MNEKLGALPAKEKRRRMNGNTMTLICFEFNTLYIKN